MQIAFTVLLIGVLAASVISFVVMGLTQLRRTNSLGRKAHEMRMHFSPGDPFDVPRRYGGFALIRSGHGPRAHNVTHGYLGGWPVRAFDFRYEVGHATRRVARHYSVIVVESDLCLPAMVMWHEDDSEAAPLSAQAGWAQVGPWVCGGDLALGRILAGACGPLRDSQVGVETQGGTVMFHMPVRKRGMDYAASLEKVERVLAELKDSLA